MSSNAISTVSAWPNMAGMRAAWIVITFGPPGVFQRICAPETASPRAARTAGTSSTRSGRPSRSLMSNRRR